MSSKAKLVLPQHYVQRGSTSETQPAKGQMYYIIVGDPPADQSCSCAESAQPMQVLNGTKSMAQVKLGLSTLFASPAVLVLAHSPAVQAATYLSTDGSEMVCHPCNPQQPVWFHPQLCSSGSCRDAACQLTRSAHQFQTLHTTTNCSMCQ